MTSVGSPSRRPLYLAAAVLAVVLLLVVLDLVSDAAEGIDARHLLLEGSAALVAALGLAGVVRGVRSLVRSERGLRHQLDRSREEAERWRVEAAEATRGFRRAIDDQMDRWELTPAEREIGLLLLQGLSHQQIAGRRSSSERTVRQQAHQLYRKAGISGRSDLSGFFLDALLTPVGEPESSQDAQEPPIED